MVRVSRLTRESLREAVIKAIEDARLSQYSLLQRTLSQLRHQMHGLMGMDQGFAVHCHEIAADHAEIVQLLRAGDAAAAGEAIVRHILAAGSEVAEQVRSLADG